MNMLSASQVMNTSFEPFHLVNTYGAFGSITRMRYEIVIEGTDEPSGERPSTTWRDTSSRASPAIRHDGRRRSRRIIFGSTG